MQWIDHLSSIETYSICGEDGLSREILFLFHRERAWMKFNFGGLFLTRSSSCDENKPKLPNIKLLFFTYYTIDHVWVGYQVKIKSWYFAPNYQLTEWIWKKKKIFNKSIILAFSFGSI